MLLAIMRKARACRGISRVNKSVASSHLGLILSSEVSYQDAVASANRSRARLLPWKRRKPNFINSVGGLDQQSVKYFKD